MVNGSPFLKIITLLIFRCVHDIGTPHRVADEAEEAQGESNDDAGENWVAVPHAAQSSRCFVVHAHCSRHHTHAAVRLIWLVYGKWRDCVTSFYTSRSVIFLLEYLNIILEDSVEEIR